MNNKKDKKILDMKNISNLNIDEKYQTILYLVSDVIEEIELNLAEGNNKGFENEAMYNKTKNIIDQMENFINDMGYLCIEPIYGTLTENEYNQFLFKSDNGRFQTLLKIGDKLEIYDDDTYRMGEIEFSNVYYFKNYFMQNPPLKAEMKCRLRVY